MKVLPDSYLRCLSPEQRRSIGQKTAQETYADGELKSEKQLQGAIATLLNLKGITFFSQRMDKRTRGKIGQPDFLFAVRPESEFADLFVTACAWEIKLPGGKLSHEQEKMAVQLQSPPNAWHWRVICSLQEAIEDLKSLGII